MSSCSDCENCKDCSSSKETTTLPEQKGISSIKDLDLNSCKDIKELEQRIQDKLGVTFLELAAKIGESVKKKAEKLAAELPNITPYGNYEKMMEKNDDMIKFLQEEASKPENWAIDYIMESDTYTNIIQFAFKSTAVDDSETLSGYVYVTFSGKIKHAFGQV